MRILTAGAALALALCSAGAADAAGVVLSDAELSSAQRQTLTREVARARQAQHGVFARVARAPELSARAVKLRRGRAATVTPYLKALGPQALMPMLEMLALDARPRAGLSDEAWLTLRVSLLEAVGMLRDARSEAVLSAALKRSAEPGVARASAEALARLGSDSAAATLLAIVDSKSAKRSLVLSVLGECRRRVVAERLAALSRAPRSDAEQKLVLQELGAVGNAWAWQTRVVNKSGERDVVRDAALGALLEAYLRHDGQLRLRALKSILLVDHPQTLRRIADLRRGASGDAARALDQLAEKVRNSPLR